LQDPMVSTSMEPEAKPSPAAVKVTIKPLATTDEPADADKPSKSISDKTIAELAAENAEEVVVKTKTNEPLADKEEKEEKEEKSEPVIKPAGAVESSDEKEETEPSSESTDDKDKSSDESLNVDDAKAAKETAELEAAAKKQEEITTLTDSKQYFLPINTVERRRSKLVSLLGLVLILALGLMLVDLMLDVGVIKLGRIHSLTHFFSS
jgi:hypothetical protein